MTIPVYTRNQPIGPDDLDISQPFLTDNTNAADSVFGLEHYPFSDASANRGLHNTVTTPGYVASPPTSLPPVTTTNPVLYGFQQTVPLGILQYSRGPSNAVPSPLTKVQSPSTPITLATNATTNLLDFTGISIALGTVYASDTVSSATTALYMVIWGGSSFQLVRINPVAGNLQVVNAGNILQLRNAGSSLSHVYWTLEFQRIQ